MKKSFTTMFLLAIVWMPFSFCGGVQNITEYDIAIAVETFVSIGLPPVLREEFGEATNKEAFLSRIEAVESMITNQILPRLLQELNPVTMTDLDDLLLALGQEMTDAQKSVILSVIRYVELKWTESYDAVELSSAGITIMTALVTAIRDTIHNFILINKGSTLQLQMQILQSWTGEGK